MGTVHCKYEPGEFDESEFEVIKKYGRVHIGRKGAKDFERHTTLGDPLEPGDIPGDAFLIRDDKQ